MLNHLPRSRTRRIHSLGNTVIAVRHERNTIEMPHPNEMDRRRILHALEQRRRYRYVKPSVACVEHGYVISSPCCSRNIDPEGGVIDIARLVYVLVEGSWRLLRKDHTFERWTEYGAFDSLTPIFDILRDDPERCFWQ